MRMRCLHQQHCESYEGFIVHMQHCEEIAAIPSKRRHSNLSPQTRAAKKTASIHAQENSVRHEQRLLSNRQRAAAMQRQSLKQNDCNDQV
ncbi:Hypothetical predicted protein [Octopus vulgaris]|uniref:Uncharacterized protein n=1 Tax=Octopus vulgaris TaxID=6645 RepID=A0AA36FDU7_OCTVU|nr:Hypothetical predicted protein [Octopus vulgaris]